MARLTFRTKAELDRDILAWPIGSTTTLDPVATVLRGSNPTTPEYRLTMIEGDYRLDVIAWTDASGDVLRVEAQHRVAMPAGGRLTLPEPLVRRFNRLLSGSNLSLKSNWRNAGGHDLRWGSGRLDPVTHGRIKHYRWTVSAGSATPPPGGGRWVPVGGLSVNLPAVVGVSPAGTGAPPPITTPPVAPTPPAPTAAPAAPAPGTAGIPTTEQRLTGEAPVKSAARRSKYPEWSALPHPVANPDGSHDDILIHREVRETWDETLGMTKIGYPAVMFAMGPTGTGKSEAIAALAHHAGMPFVATSAMGMQDPDQWFGSMQYDPADKAYKFMASQMWAALTDFSVDSVIFVDELNRCEGRVGNGLMDIFASKGGVTEPQSGQRKQVNRNCILVAAANIGAEYVSTEPLDPALDNRLSYRAEFEYMPESVEADLLMARFGPHGLSRYHAEQIAKAGAEIRTSAKSLYHLPLSTRLTTVLAAAITVGADPLKAVERAILRQYSRSGDLQSEQHRVRQAIIGIVWDEPKGGAK